MLFIYQTSIEIDPKVDWEMVVWYHCPVNWDGDLTFKFFVDVENCQCCLGDAELHPPSFQELSNGHHISCLVWLDQFPSGS